MRLDDTESIKNKPMKKPVAGSPMFASSGNLSGGNTTNSLKGATTYLNATPAAANK